MAAEQKRMTPGLRITLCSQCDTPYFPRRLICHVCGNDTWTEETLNAAVIEETTTVLRAVGGANEPRLLATVKAKKVLHIIVGLEEPLPEGSPVQLFDKDGAPIARLARQSEVLDV